MAHPSTEPRVSIILPCRNERRHIEACLASTLAQGPPPGGFEIIVADGMSDDGTREILHRIASASQLSTFNSQPQRQPSTFNPQPSTPCLRIIDNPGRIVSTGLNAAIRAARGDIIIRLDAHTEYAPDYVVRCVEILETTGADNVGGPWIAKGDTLMSHAIAAAFQSPFAAGGASSHKSEYEGEVDSVYLGCWPRATFEKFGLFDEELVRNQDDEHNLRISRGGGKVYQSPKIKSWYRPRSSLGALFKQYMQYGYWKVRVIQKHTLPASWRHLVPGLFVFTLATLFLLSAFCFLLSRFAVVNGPWSVVSHFSFQLSAFSFLLLLSAYAACVLVASIITAAKTEWKMLPLLPLVFPGYHFGYGIGFLRGIWDFVIRKKSPGRKFAVLTR